MLLILTLVLYAFQLDKIMDTLFYRALMRHLDEKMVEADFSYRIYERRILESVELVSTI